MVKVIIKIENTLIEIAVIFYMKFYVSGRNGMACIIEQSTYAI